MIRHSVLLFSFAGYLVSQTCLIDGLALAYTGQSDNVNGEQLHLFRCVGDHEMWLSELQKTQPASIPANDETQSMPLPVVESVSIEESGIETLFHEKLESDKTQQEHMKKEQSNLDAIMKDQQKLFSMRFRNYKSGKNQKASGAERPVIGVATYTAGVIAILALLVH